MELGIKGHSKRGKEVIKLLESLGGVNYYILTGDNDNKFYYIRKKYKDIEISYIGPDEIKDYEIFSLEDFLEKFPYKVGDKVNVWVNHEYLGGPRAELEVAEIKSMRWNSARSEIAYKMKDITKEIYKDDIKGKVDDNLIKTTKDMRNKLAIKGHSTRGKEVIELLEMLGGSNVYKHMGINDETFYYINDTTGIHCGQTLWNNNRYTIFTLEEFLEKYPFKVGDRVRIPEYESEVRIDKMYWDGYEIQYEVYTDEVETYSAEELNQWNESNNKSKTKMNNTQESLLKKNSITISSLCYEDEVELNFSCEYELIERNGKHILIKKKPKYPKTYEECCKVLSIPSYYKLKYSTYEHNYHEYTTSKKLCLLQDNLNRLGKLLICRDAYWKIAGEEMELGKSWEPDYDSGVNKYGIICINGVVQKSNPTTNWERHLNKVLDFPTEKMRNAFYENFKDLIEDCKDLL